MTAALLYLLKGCSSEDVAWLTRGNVIYSNIYMLEHTDVGHRNDLPGFSAFLPGSEEVPWPVALLLGSHSKKFIWEPVRKPAVSNVGKALTLCQRRLYWAWVHRRNPSEYLKPLVPHDVPACTAGVDDAVSAYSRSLRRCVLQYLARAGSSSPPLPRYIKFSLRWLVDTKHTCELSDKDGVFVLVSHDAYRRLQAFELAKPCYRPTSSVYVQVAFEQAVKTSLSLATSLAQLGHTKWGCQVTSWVDSHKTNLAHFLCKWSCTIKTHKPPGSVVARSIHSSREHLHNAISEVVNRLLTPFLREQAHICWSSEDVQRGFSKAFVNDRTTFMKFDIKEFFLSGDHEELATLAASISNNRQERAWLKRAIFFLLSSQFVEFCPAEDVALQVAFGSGMGMRHSGTVSDAAFLAKCELHLLPRFRELGVELYLRYKDDLITAVSSPQVGAVWRDALINGAAPVYEVQLESVSLVGCPMLDLLVFKHSTGGQTSLRWKPFVKPTARHIPLSSSSCHSWRCHNSWPVAEVKRMHSRSVEHRHFLEARASKLDRFRSFFLQESIVAAAEAWTPRIVPSCVSFVELERVYSRPIRLVLPYSSRLRGLSNAIARHDKEWQDSFCLRQFPFRIQLSWARGGRPLWQLARLRVDPHLEVYRAFRSVGRGR